MNSSFSACIIGVSGFGSHHYRDLQNLQRGGKLRIIGATIINEEEEAEKCDFLRSVGCRIFSDYEAMLAECGSRTDLCCIPTGIHHHAPMTIAALQAGTNVLVEKPAAATIQEVRAMQYWEKKTNRFVAVGYQSMYATETLWIKQAILDGKIGALRSIKCRGLWPRLESYYARNEWAGRLRRGKTWVLDSPFNNAFAHWLNMICFLAGDALRETASLKSIQAELYRAHRIESADTACLRVITTTDLPLYLFVSHSPEKLVEPEIIVRGETGEIHWTPQSVCLTNGSGLILKRSCDDAERCRSAQISAALQRIKDPSVFICGLDIAAAQTLCVNGAHDSAEICSMNEGEVLRYGQDGSTRVAFQGIDQAILQSLEEEKLFSEMGFAWARPGRVVSLLGYEEFAPEAILPATTPRLDRIREHQSVPEAA